jgi:secretion/DNA translocation related TadE-like protein
MPIPGASRTETQRGSAVSRRPDDRGAATVWVIGCGAVLFAITLVVVLRSLAVLARHRAESAADFAALAAAGRIGVGGDPCDAARQFAARNRAAVKTCSVSLAADGRSGTVFVRVMTSVDLPVVGQRGVTASARAGRLPAARPRETSPPSTRPSGRGPIIGSSVWARPALAGVACWLSPEPLQTRVHS